jgi:hypothetical protein
LQSVTILRTLWRRRLAVGGVLVVSVTIGWLLAFQPSFPPKARSYSVGTATASVLVDTPKSQVVEVAPQGSDTLGSRANVLANLMIDGEIKTAIAQHVGLRPNRIVATTLSGGVTDPPPPLTARSYAMSTSVAMTSDMVELPIIRVQTQAPNVGDAIKLANAAVAGLSEYLDAKAVNETVADRRRLRVRPLGTAQGQVAVKGPRPVTGIGIGLVLFLAGCGTILALSALIRGWRAAAALERRSPETDSAPEDAPADAPEDNVFDEHDWSAEPLRSEATNVRAR